MSTRQIIEKRLSEHFLPQVLEVIDESYLHAGHQPGMDGSGESHMRIRIVAEAFRGQTRISRHRAINSLVAPEISAGLHALSIEAYAPGEPAPW